ncbi:MAG: hypothetical protein B7Y45_13570, partial [Sphingomonas sp. 28-66-16]
MGAALFGATPASAQSSACTLTSGSVASLQVTAGSSNNIVINTSNSGTQSTIYNNCGNQYVYVFDVYDNASFPTIAQNTEVTIASGSKLKFTASGSGSNYHMQIYYTPAPGFTGTETIAQPIAQNIAANPSITRGLPVEFAQASTPFSYLTLQIVVTAPAAPTAALTSLTPSSITSGGTSAVVVTLTNPNSTAPLSGVSDTINLPSGVTLASNVTASQCSGTVTGSAGASAVSLSGGSLTTSGTCTISFSVTSATVNTYQIPSGTPSATGASAGSAGTTSTLTVTAPPVPTVTNVAPANVPLAGGTITITGTNFVIGSTSFTVGGTPATGVSCSSATTCTATAPAKAAGAYSVVATTAGGASTTNGTLTYLSPPTVAAAFSPTSVANGGTATLTLTITNPNAGTALTGVAVASASLPTNLSGSSPATTCSGGTATFAGNALSLSGATLAGGASCTTTLSVTSTTPATYNYTSGVVSASGPISLTGVSATTSPGLTVNAAATTTSLTSSQNPQRAGATVTFTATVTSSSTVNAGTVNFTAGGSTITGTSGSCGTVAVNGSGIATCTTSSLPVGTSTIQAIYAGSANFATSTSNNITQYVVTAPTVSGVFSPASITTAQTSTLTITLTNPAANTVSLDGVQLASTSLTGLTGLTLGSSTCSSPSIAGVTVTAGPTTLGANGSCTVVVNVPTGQTASSYSVTLGAPSATQANGVSLGATLTGVSGSAGPLTVTAAPPTLAVAISHTGNFTQGQTGTITVTPSATVGDTAGTLTFSITPPTGATYSSFTGTGWSCSGGAPVSCTSTTVIAAGTSGNPISLTFAIGAAAPVNLNFTGTLSGGGAVSSVNSNTDPVTVIQVPASVSITAGDNQSATVSTAFATALQVTVRDAASVVIPSQSVTFAAPGSGASGTFATSGSNAQTVTTNASGVATASTFTANATVGGPYAVSATAGSAPAANFSLTNSPVALVTTQAVPTVSGTVGAALPAVTPVTASGGTTPL